MNENSDTSRQDTLRDARKQIVRSLFLALAALGVIVFACYAWFVSSQVVTGSLGSVQLSGGRFELASVGAAGKFDNKIPEYDEFAPIQQEYSGKTYEATADYRNAVLWRLSNDSHLGNRQDNQEDTGIEPGTNGTLQFYVIPKEAGTLELTVHLRLIPMAYPPDDAVDKTMGPISANSKAYDFMKGHLLFSYQCAKDKLTAPNTSFTLVNYQTGSFPLTFEVTETDVEQPILVELKWIWPLYLKNILQNDLHLYTDEAYSEIIKWMEDDPAYFFYNGETQVENPTEKQLESREYNDYFNNADQCIGDDVDGVLLRLSAVEN